jgi:hypothetical protein
MISGTNRIRTTQAIAIDVAYQPGASGEPSALAGHTPTDGVVSAILAPNERHSPRPVQISVLDDEQMHPQHHERSTKPRLAAVPYIDLLLHTSFTDRSSAISHRAHLHEKIIESGLSEWK